MNSYLNIEDQTILPMDYNNLLYNDILVYDCKDAPPYHVWLQSALWFRRHRTEGHGDQKNTQQ